MCIRDRFSLPKLYAMKRIVFGLGLLQVLATLAVVTAVLGAAGLSWQAGVALGGALAMSSTAVLTKLLNERLELDAPHGREVMGVLLFQDPVSYTHLDVYKRQAPAFHRSTTDRYGASATASFSCASRMNSQTSRTAPRPPQRVAISEARLCTLSLIHI